MSGSLNTGLLIGAAVLLVAVGAVRMSARLGVPSLVAYLALGLAIGESGLGIQFENVELTRTLGVCALIVIIAEGGLTARWPALRPVLPLATALSTIGVAASVAVVGVMVHFVLGIDWRLSLLYGAVLSSTGAAAVFSTLRRLRLRPRPVAALEAESGMNDAPAILLVVLLSTTAVGPGDGHAWWQQVLLVGFELAAGAAIGYGVGSAGRLVLGRGALPSWPARLAEPVG